MVLMKHTLLSYNGNPIVCNFNKRNSNNNKSAKSTMEEKKNKEYLDIFLNVISFAQHCANRITWCLFSFFVVVFFWSYLFWKVVRSFFFVWVNNAIMYPCYLNVCIIVDAFGALNFQKKKKKWHDWVWERTR